MFTGFDISMVVPGLPFDGQSLETKSLGGSEGAALYMAKALAQQGARVMVFCHTPNASTDERGVQYLPLPLWRNFVKEAPHDVCIAQRTSEPFAQRINSRLNLVWCHDLATRRDAERFRGALWNVDRVIVLSRFMRDQYKEVLGLDDDAFFESRNGIDLQLFQTLRATGIARDRKKLMYAARPERGLDLLLRDIMPRLLKRNPDLRLYIAGYEGPRTDWKTYDDDCRRLAERLGDRVVWLGALTRRELYAHYLSAGVYVYPTPSSAHAELREVSCISAMECQAAGLPIVTSRLGALAETVAPGAGALLELDPSDDRQRRSYCEQFSERVLEFVANDRAWEAASSVALTRAAELDWSEVARAWLLEFERAIRQGSAPSERLVRHFHRNSDVIAAKHALACGVANEQAHDAQPEKLAALFAPWSFLEEADGWRKRYEQGLAEVRRSSDEVALEAERMLRTCEWFGEHRRSITNVLDYGCGDGSLTLELARQCPELSLHGVDVLRNVISTASTEALKEGLASRVSFSLWGSDSPEPLRSGSSAAFDAALLGNVLAFVAEPWSVLERVEREVRPGGKVCFSVPFGPREFTSQSSAAAPPRQVWHFDAHDLRDMIGDKPGLEVEAVYVDEHSVTGDAMGFWLASYIADHAPVTPIDLDRHCWLQRPRHTMSASIIAGPGSEETLHWMLRSIQDVCDEIIVADCGMGEEARRIAGQYPVQLIAGVDPKREGFERARNLALDACRGDFCLWIDTDERLTGTKALPKYLRENVYHAYSIKQHQFSCDGEPSWNAPARLFRRRPYQGRSLRFFGAIHELPELGVNEGPGPATYLSDVHIGHVGYVVESSRRSRFKSNLPLLDLDQERYPERIVQKFYMMRENMHLVRLAFEQSGRVESAIKAKCRETVDLYRKHLLAEDQDPNHEGLRYYSEALEFLGEGFEVALHLEAHKQRAPVTSVQTFRFASSEDLMAVLKREVSRKARPCELPWW